MGWTKIFGILVIVGFCAGLTYGLLSSLFGWTGSAGTASIGVVVGLTAALLVTRRSRYPGSAGRREGRDHT